MVFPIGLGALVAALILLVCLSCFSSYAQAAKYPASTLDLYVNDRAAFNLAVPGESKGLFEDGDGPEISPGQAGLAMFVDELGASVGLSQSTAFQPLSGPEVAVDDPSVRMVETRVQVMTGGLPLFEVTQSILQSKEERGVGIVYSVENVYFSPLSFRPYLLGNLRLDAANTARSTYSTSPSANLTVASTTTPRVMEIIVTGNDLPPNSVKVGAWADVGLDTPAANLTYGQFVPSIRTNPAFGVEWSAWQNIDLDPSESVELISTFIASGRTPTPEPVRGKTAVVEPVGGKVLVKTPGGTYRELEADRAIPVGSLVDVRKGTIRLTSAGTGSKDQTAKFRSGIFRILQKRSSPLTTLKLAGPLVGCGRTISDTDSGLRRRSGKGRKVWGSGKGKFKTSGRRGSGSVRGTTWQVTDNCNGSTRIQSISGTVIARDFGKGPRFKRVLRKGQSYLARARR